MSEFWDGKRVCLETIWISVLERTAGFCSGPFGPPDKSFWGHVLIIIVPLVSVIFFYFLVSTLFWLWIIPELDIDYEL